MDDDMMTWLKAEVKDIGKDTDKLLERGASMSDGFDMGVLTGMLNNRDGGFGGNGFADLVLLAILFGWGGNGFGFGGRGVDTAGVAGVDRTVVNEANYSRLMDALNATGTRQEVAIGDLATATNLSFQDVQKAICDLRYEIATKFGSVENMIQQCCCNIGNKIQQCCCETNLNVERTGNAIQQQLQANNFAMSNFFAAQTQLIQQQFCNQNAYLADQFCQIKERELGETIQSLRDRLAEQSQQAQTALILNAINGKDTINYTGTISGSDVTGTGTIS